MARIFSISFFFDNSTYTALVNVRTAEDATAEYTVTVLDDAVSRLLPGNKIISPAPGELIFQNADTGNEILMNAILRAVSAHLNSVKF